MILELQNDNCSTGGIVESKTASKNKMVGKLDLASLRLSNRDEN